MEGWKSIIASTTFWGAVLSLASLVGALFNFSLAAQDQSELVEALAAIGVAVGSVTSVIGRMKAKTRVSITGKPKE